MKTSGLFKVFVVGLLVFVLAVPVHAFPAVTYAGEASASAIDIGLGVTVLTVPSSADVIVAASEATLDGMVNTPVTTSGRALTSEIAAGTGGFVSLNAVLNPTSTTKTYQDAMGNPVTASLGVSALIGLAGTLSVDVGVVETNSSSGLLPDETFPTTMESEAGSEVEDTDIALVTSLLTTDVLTSTARTETTDVDPDHDAVCSSEVELTGVTVDLSALGLTLLGIDQIITADVITANTTAVSDGTLPSAAAVADYGFVNLVVDGVSINPTTPQVIVLIDTLLVDVFVEIAPVQDTFTSDTLSTADAVALRIVVDVDTIGSETNVVIDLGTAHSSCGAADGPDTGPTVIDLVSLSAASPGMTPFALFAVVGLGLVSVFLLKRSRM